jgi:SAM-dependent methyltransferase
MSSWFRKTYRFNQVSRDEWVAAQARTVPANVHVLDVGAGSSPYRALFAHTNFRTHDFCQLKPEQLLGGSGYSPIDYVSDVTAIPAPDGSFEVILCTEVLEHVPEPIAAIKEMARLLKPGGTLLLTAPLGSGLHQQPFHFYGGYTPHFYQRVLKEAGMTVELIEPNGNFYRFFAQEFGRFVLRSAPWRAGMPLLARLVWAPVWAGFAATSAVFFPLARALDHTDRVKDFTVGYHVRAVKLAAEQGA